MHQQNEQNQCEIKCASLFSKGISKEDFEAKTTTTTKKKTKYTYKIHYEFH